MGAGALDVVEQMIAAERAKGPARGFFHIAWLRIASSLAD